eukprot:COSAG01_NODE_25957_length_727_cov_84.523885_2_plen_75_part_01
MVLDFVPREFTVLVCRTAVPGVHPLFDPSAQAALFHARHAASGMGEDIPEQATGGDLEELLDEIKGNLNQPEHAG